MDPETGLPLAFGKQAPTKKQVDTTRIDKTKRLKDKQGDEAAQRSNGRSATNDEVNTASHSAEPIADDSAPRPVSNDVDDLPITHEVVLKDHVKTVSALSLDPSGARVVSGSYDYDCKLWDFGGMKSDFKPFRSFEPKAGHQVIDAQFSPSGDTFIVVTGSDQVKHYDRDGAEIGEFYKGDMYIRDLRNTGGHVAAIRFVSWNPANPTQFLTGSSDSTLRIWDKDTRRNSSKTIVVKSKERGGKTKVSAGSWSRDGKWIAAACEDGSLHLWRSSSNFTRPDYSNEKAHEKGTITSAVAFSPDGKYLATRGGDGTVKLWNPKSVKKPLSTISSLPSLNSETSLCFSPSGRYLLTGTAGSKAGVLPGNAEEAKSLELEKELGARMGSVVVIEVKDEGEMEVRERIEIDQFSVVKVVWHEKINQILASTASGAIHVLYSPSLSTKGALLGLTRQVRKPNVESTFRSSATELDRPVIAPHSLPMFKDDATHSAGGRGGKRKREKERHDPQKTLKPMPPVVGPGRGGRVGASATQHVVQGLVRNSMRDQDPREALLKYATSDPSENTWTAAWAATQPKPVFDDRADSDDDKEKERPK
ncbi:hypothetical protein JCM10212_003294 [Sporobolomyces blumeae]